MTAAQKAGAEKKARIASLTNTIANFRRQDLAGDPRCTDAMEALDGLQSGGLAFGKSLDLIRTAGAARRVVTYGQVAAASGLAWKAARRPINRHLDELCVWAHAQGFPLVTAIVVEGDNADTGLLGPTAMAGFLAAAQRLGVVVGADEASFLREEQERVFAWASGGAGT